MSIKTIQSCCYKTIKKWRKIRFALHIVAIHLKLVMQPIVLIGGVGTLLGYEFNNINDKTNNSMVKDDNCELIQLGLLLLNSYPSNVPTPPIRTIGCITNLR